MQLTQQQLNHFEAFGFLVFRQLLSPEEIKQYSDEFNAAIERVRTDAEHGEPAYHFGFFTNSNTPFIVSLMSDPRFVDAAEQLLGKPVLGVAPEGNFFVGDTRWHADGRTFGYTGVKFCVYPDPLNASNGALRVIPSSHREPLHQEMERAKALGISASDREPGEETQAVFGVTPAEMPAYVFESKPGDVLVFRLPLWHGAFGGEVHRRQGAICFYEDPNDRATVSAIREQMLGNHRMLRRRMIDDPRVTDPAAIQFYPPYWRSFDNPKHQRWVRRWAELGVLDAPADC